MGDPEPRDRETIGAGGSEPEATVAGLGTNGPPDTPGRAPAGEIDPGPAIGGVAVAHDTAVTATGAGAATHAGPTDSPPAHRPAPTIAGYVIEGELGRGGMGVVYRARQVRLNRPCALKMILAGAHATPEAVGLRAAPTIPGYEILGELGRGGMGVVYHARQVRLNRPVALKVILAGPHTGAEAAARFLAEAQAVAKVQHPNIVQIFHVDEHAGFPYFEMEFISGGSLADQLDGTPRPPREATRLVETLARAMAEAHRQGIVHRDLKPRNILLTPEGTPKVADFGLAKLLNAESGLTRTDSVLGTPSYMAPEQAEGKAKQVGPLADVYALGAILYELLTGGAPFRGTTALEILEQVKHAEPVPPSRLVPGSFCKHFNAIVSRSRANPGTKRDGGRGSTVLTCSRVSRTVAPRNGGRPVKSS